MRSRHLLQWSGIVTAFALGLLTAGPLGRVVTSARASSDVAAPSTTDLARTVAQLNARMNTLENTEGVRATPSGRPPPIKVTPPAGSDPLTQLQQRVASLEETLFGPAPAGGRPRIIQSNAVGNLQQRVDQVIAVQDSDRAMLATALNSVNGLQSNVVALNQALGATNQNLAKYWDAFKKHQHHLWGAYKTSTVIGNVQRWVPATQSGEDPSITDQIFCGDYKPNSPLPSCGN